MKDILLQHFAQALQVFAGTFIVTFGTILLNSHSIVFSGPFFYGLLVAAFSAGAKEVAAKFFPLALGGRTIGSKTLLGARKG